MARRRRNPKVTLLGVIRRRRSALLVSTALCATVTMVVSLPVRAQPAPNARPAGGVVSAGVAAISQTSNKTTIAQTTQNAAINWQSFNVGSQQSVQFAQPSSSAMTLNRVVGPNPSQIAGRIDANGQVILVNQSGVTFYKGAQVNTAGLMVSAAGISDANFMAGKMKFDQPGAPNAKVENQGNITIKQAGLAALVAPQVANSGTISAKLGHVVLAGAQKATLDLYGDGMLSIDVSGQVVQAPNGATALVTNTGVIQANGGTVQLTARAADGVVQNLVDAGGHISAASLGSRTGRIALNGVGGSVIVEGQLVATGRAPGTTGGKIDVNATGNVTVASHARIDASGKAGGGVVAIGTTLRRAAGGPGVASAHTAKNVIVQPGARIAADATAQGNGGRVALLSTNSTRMGGTITANGGPVAGNGGFVEVSGNQLGLTGSVGVAAPHGTLGTILLDPDYLNIVSANAGSTEDANFASNGGSVLAGDGNTGTPDTISNGVINAFTGNVLLQANRTLTVAAPISLTNSPGQNLVLEAGGTVTVNSGINVLASGNVILATGGAGPASPPAAQSSPLIALFGTVGSTGGSVSLLAGSGGTISIGAASMLTAASGERATLQGDKLSIAAGGTVSAPLGTIEIAPASAIAIHLGGTSGLALSQATLNALSASTLRLGGATINNALTQAASAISIDGAISLSGIAATFDLQSSGAVTQSAALSNVGTLTGNTGAVTLNNAGNAGIATVGSYSVISGSDFTLTTSGSLDIDGPLGAHNVTLNAGTIGATGSVTASNLATLVAGAGGIALNAGAVLSGATVDISASGGGVTQVADSGISATTLRSTANVTGGLSLLGTANAIANIGPLTVSTGNAAVTDTAGLTVAGLVSASAGNVYLQDSNSAGITFGASQEILSVTGGTVGLQTNKLVNLGTIGAKGTVNTGSSGTFELAPVTLGTVVSLGTTSGLSLATLTGITSNTVRVGAIAVPGSGLTTTAGSIEVAGASFSAAATKTLELDATINGGGTGGISQVQALTNVGTLAGTAASYTLTTLSNTIGNVGALNATIGNIAISDSSAMTIVGTANAVGGNVYLQTSGAGGITFGAAGVVESAAGGRIGLLSNTLVNIGTTGATGVVDAGATGTVEFAPNKSGNTITLGASSGLSLLNLVGITTGTLRVGGVTAPAGSSPSTTAGAISIAGSFDLGGANLDLRSNAAVTQAAALTTVGTLTGAATGFTLTDSGNAIGAVGSLTAKTGTVAIVDSVSLSIVGTVSATAGDIYLASAGAGGITFGASGDLQSVSGGVIGLQAEALTNLGAAGSTGIANAGAVGTLEFAPNTAGAMMTLGTVSGASLAGLTGIIAGTLRIGAVTQPGSAAPTVLAGSIAVADTFDAGNAVLDLRGSGALTQSAPLLNVATLTGTVARVALTNPANTIAGIGPLTATAGSIAVMDASAVTIGGLLSASAGNLYLESSQAGGITFGTAGAIQSVSGGMIGLQADALLNLGTTGATGVVNAGATGTFELAPNSAAAITLGAASGLSLANLTGITAGTLRIGGVTTPGNIAPVSTATSIAIASAFDVGGANLSLLSNGAVTQAAALTTVGTLSGAVGTLMLSNSGNSIGAVGSLTATSGDIALGDSAALTVAGPVQAVAGNIYLETSNAGGITLNAALQSVASGRIGLQTDALANLGTTSATGAVNAGSSGTFELAPNTTGNTITLGNVAGLSLANLTGITAGLLRIGAATLPGAATPTITSGAVAVTGTFDGGGIATLELDAVKGVGSGAVTQSAPLLNFGTLSSTADSFSLNNPSNSIGTLGVLTGTGASSDFVVNDATAATIAGTLSLAGSGTLTLNAPSLSIGGGTAGVIDASNLVINSSGSINEAANGTLIVNSLSIITTSPGDVILNNKNNQIANLTGMTVKNGNLVVVDDPTLTLTGTYSANNLFFQVTAPGDTIALGAGTPAVLISTLGSGGRISLIADNLTHDPTSTITAINGTVEIAPFSTTVPVSFAGASQLQIDASLLSHISTGTLVAGQFTDVNNGNSVSITAAGISLDGAVNLIGNANALVLVTLGSISEPTGPLTVGTLSGVATAATFGSAGNNVGTLAGFVASGGAFTLSDSGNTGNLAVAGSVTATSVTIGNANTGTISVAGDIGATGGVTLASGSGGIALNNGAVLSGTTVDLSASSTGITQAANATILATSVLQSSGLVGGTVDLAGTANAVASIGSFEVLGGDFTLIDAAHLVIAGPLTANDVVLNAPTLAVTGSLGVLGTLSLTAGSGGIALNSGAVLSGATVDLSASGGGITQAATGEISATLLQSNGGVTGTVTLPGNANAIGAIGSFTVSGGDFSLADGGSLDVTGRLAAMNVTLQSPGITVAGTAAATSALVLAAGSGGIALNGSDVLSGATVDLSATGGGVTQAASGTLVATTLLQSASGVSGTVALAGTANDVASIGTFAVSGGDLTLVDGGHAGNLAVSGLVTATDVALSGAGTISVSSSVGAGGTLTLSAGNGGISLGASDVLSGATIDLSATGGGVTQAATGTLAANLLRSGGGVTGTVDLAGTVNNVATLGGFAVSSGNFTLADAGNSGALAVNGPVTAANVAIGGAGTVSIAGSIGATTSLVLAAGNGGIALNGGDVLSGATVDLSATGGGVAQAASGTITAAALRSASGVGGTVDLAGTANAIGSVGSFAVTSGDFILVDTGNLALPGRLTATNITLDSATITAIGSVGATATLVLTAGGGGIALNSGAALSGATVDVSAAGGGITQAATGAIAATLLQSSNGVTGTVSLGAASNNIGTVGAFIVSGGNFLLADAGDTGRLAVTGPVSANNVAFIGAGTIGVSGGITATTSLVLASGSGGVALNNGGVLSAATLDLSATGGGVTQVASGTITAGALQSSGGVTGTISLPGSGNAIGGIGGFAVSSGDFLLLDSGSLGVSGALTAGNVALSSTTLAVGGSVGATGALVLNAGAGGIRLNSGDVLSGAAVDLSATGGGVTQLASGTIAAGVLQSGSGIAGGASLAGTANAIGTLGAFAVSSGDFLLADAGNAGNLAVVGPVSATNVTIGDANTGTISVTGSIGATSALGLSSGSGGIRLNAGDVLSGATVDLAATGGGITQTASGTLSATALLQSATGVGGTVALGGTSNVVGAIGSFAVSGGDFTLRDTSGVAVNGALSANNVSLTSPTISANGTIGAVTAAVLVAGSGGIALNTGDLLSGATVDLSATGGGVTQATGGTLLANGVLRSIGGVTGTVSLAGTANDVASLGSFVVSGGDFSLLDKGNIGNLAVSGPVTATNLSITDGGTLSVGASLGATGVLVLASSGGGIALNNGAVLSGTTVDLSTTGGGVTQVANGTIDTNLLQSAAGVTGTVSLPGSGNAIAAIGSFAVSGGDFRLVDSGALVVSGLLTATGIALNSATITANGSIGASTVASLAVGTGGIQLNAGDVLSGATVDLSATGGGVTQAAGGTLIATALLQSGAGVSGTVGLAGTANSVAAIGRFAVSGGDFSLSDTSNVNVAGPLTAANVAIGNGGTNAISVGGSIGATTSLVLASGSGGVTLSAGDVLSGATVDLSATGGGITQAASGTLIATALLQSASGVTGTANLGSTTNAVATLGSFAVSGGNFVLADNGNTGNLQVTGPVTAANVAIGNANTGTISVSGSVGATTLVALAAGSGGISLGAGDVLSAPTVDLSAAGGGVTQAASGTIDATALLQSTSGVVGTVSLIGTTNDVGGIGNFSASGFTLNDGAALTIGGVLNGGSVATIVDKGALNVSGAVSATSIGLTADSVGIPGTVSGGTVALTGTVGAITETGTLIAGTLTGSAIGTANLTGATAVTNQIGTLGGFTAAGFTLNDGVALQVTGVVNAGSTAVIASAGALSVSNTLSSSGTVSLTGSSLTLASSVSDGGAGTTMLVATAGTIGESGTLIAGTLSGSATGAASLLGASATTNQIGTLGNFGAGALSLDDGGALLVAGSVGATSIGITATGISIPGVVNGGTVALTGTVSTISETGTLIAGTLTGSSVGGTSLTGANASANQVGTLGGFTAAGFVLNDGTALTVAGVLNAGASAVIADAGLLTVSGSVMSAGSVNLSGGSVALAGLVTDGAAGATTLVATSGSIGETGTLIAGTLSGSSSGATSLTGATTTANQVATLASFSANGFTLDDGVALTVNGPVNGGSAVAILDKGALAIAGTVTAAAIGLTADSLTIGGVVNGGSVAMAGTLAGISETGTIIAGTLSGTAAAGVTLGSTANVIGTLAAYTLGSGNFALIDDGNSGNLAVTGPVSAANVSIGNANTGTISVIGSIGAGTSLLLASGSGGIALNGSAALSSATIDLSATGGGIAQAATGTLTATLLQSTSGATGNVDLAGTANNIATLGGFNVSLGDFTLVDSGNTGRLAVTGPVTATNVAIDNANSGSIVVSGSVSATTVLALASGSGGIALNAGEVLSGATVDLSTTGGGVTQVATGTIVATTLLSTSNVIGGISLPGTGNLIGSFGTLSAASGDIDIEDNAALTITGVLRAASGNVFLATPNAGGITINGAIQSAAGGHVGLLADTLGNIGSTGATGVISTGTLEIAPSTTSHAITLGAASGLSLTNMVGISTNLLRVGAVTLPGSVAPTVSGGAINVAGLFALGGSNLELLGSGAVTGTGAVTSVGTLTGQAASFSLTNAGNGIGDIGSLVATGGTIAIGDSAALTISGTVQAAGNAYLQSSNAGGIAFGASGAVLSAGGGVVALQADALANLGSVGATGVVNAGAAGTFELAPNTVGAGLALGGGSGLVLDNLTGITAGLLRFGGVTEPGGSAPTTAAGPIAIGGAFDVAGRNVQLLANGAITQSASLTNVGTLTGSAGSVALTNAGNLIGTLGAFSTTAGFVLTDDAALLVGGPVSDSGAASTLALTTRIGGLTLAGNVSASDALDLVAAGTISQSGGSISAGTLIGSATTASLTAAGNAVASLGAFSTSAGFALNDHAALQIAGPVQDTGAATTLAVTTTVGGIAISGNVKATDVLDIVSAGSISQSGGSIAAAVLTGRAAGAASLTQPGNLVGTLSAFSSGGGFALTDNQTLLVAGPVSDTGVASTLALTTRSGDLDLTGIVSAADAVALVSAGAINQTGGSITAATLSGSAVGTANLAQLGNAVGTLGAFTTGAGFTLTDNAALLVNGAVSDAGAATALALTTRSGGMTLAGSISATNLLSLNAAGSINQTGGSIDAATLNGSAAGSASLAQTGNLIGTLGAFTTTSGFALTDNEALLVNGPVSDTGAASALALTTRTGGLSLAGKVSATNVLDLVSAGTISQSAGSITAATLTGSATNASLTQANLIGTLGAFSTTSGFALTDNAPLLVNGPLSDSGAASALVLDITTSGLTLAGNVSATHILDLIAAGTISQSGGAISAGTLIGSATAASLTQVGNLVGTLGAFTTSAGFALTDNESLLVAGPVQDSGGASTLSLDVGSGNLTLAGAVSAGNTLDLVAAGTISQTGGSISAATLTGSAGSGDFALTASANRFTSAASITAGGTMTLIDHAASLTLSGGVQAAQIDLTMNAANATLTLGTNSQGVAMTATGGTGISLVADRITEGSAPSTLTTNASASIALTPFTAGVGASLAGSAGAHLLIDSTLLGAISTGRLAVTADGISIDGLVDLTGHAVTLALVSQGAISEQGGPLTVGALTGSAATSATLAAANQIGTLGAFTTGAGFTLNDAQALLVNGPVQDTGATSTLALTDAGAGLTLAGNVSAANALQLVSSGSIVQTGGSISAATLSGSAANAVSLTQASNAIGTLGNFTASSFALSVTPNLLLSGNVNGGSAVSMSDAGNLTITGGIRGTNVALTASAIDATGSVDAASLTGTVTGSASFTGGNSIASLGSFTAPAGLVLHDNAALTLAGPVGASTASITDARAINVAGGITATTTLDLTAATGIALGNSAVVQAATIALDGGSGGIALTGNAVLGQSGALLDVTTTGGITEAASSRITGGTLQSNGGVTGNVALDGTQNVVAVLANFPVTSGDFGMIDTGSLTVTGAVSANDISLSNSGAAGITVSNALSATGTLGINAGSFLSLTGGATLTAPVINLNSGSGAIALTGNATLGATMLDFTTAAGGLSEANTATINAGTLTSRAGIGGDVALAGAANSIASIGLFSASGAFALTDNGDVAINGALSASNVSITTSGSGAISANAGVNVDPASGTLTLVSGSGGIAVSSGGSLGGAVVDLTTSGGGVTEAPTGIISTGLLRSSGGVAGDVSLHGLQNAVTAIGNLTVLPGTFGLYTNSALTMSGTLAATAIALESAGNLSIPGAVVDPPIGSVELVSDKGGISEVGSLVAALLTGSAANTVSLTGSNQVSELGNFTVANGAFTLNDNANLLISGVISAATINISDTGNTVTLGNGAGFVTAGLDRPLGSLPINQLPPSGTTNLGAYIIAGDIMQSGGFTVTGLNGGPSLLNVNVGGSVSFDPNVGLRAPGTWLEINLVGGDASGAINVKALDISYVLPSANAQLTATINGLSGSAAAGQAFIEPRPNANFQLDGCPIHSVNCVLLPSQSLPAASPINDIFFGALFNPQDQGDLLLPIVSDRDY